MGPKDRIKDAVDSAADSVADRTEKHRVGFEPSVCQGCPKRGDGPLRACQLCGCPTIRNGTLDMTGMVPDGCPRIREHERRS